MPSSTPDFAATDVLASGIVRNFCYIVRALPHCGTIPELGFPGRYFHLRIGLFQEATPGDELGLTRRTWSRVVALPGVGGTRLSLA